MAFTDNSGFNPVLCICSHTLMGGTTQTFTLTSTGKIYYGYCPYFDYFPHEDNIEEFAKKYPDAIHVLEDIDISPITDYLSTLLKIDEEGYHKEINLQQSFGLHNGCDGSILTIEIFGIFRTIGHFLQCYLGEVPLAYIEGGKADKQLVEWFCILLNTFRLIYKQCSIKKIRKYLLKFFDTYNALWQFDYKQFYESETEFVTPENIDIISKKYAILRQMSDNISGKE